MVLGDKSLDNFYEVAVGHNISEATKYPFYYGPDPIGVLLKLGLYFSFEFRNINFLLFIHNGVIEYF